MDGDPTLVFKPVFKSFKFKTSEAMEGLKVQRNTSMKDSNEFIDNPKRENPEVVQSPHSDEKWKAAMDYDLPELVAFLQDSGYPFVKDICIDSVVPSQNKCLEENCDLDFNNVSCMVSSDAESSSKLTVESQCSSESSNSSVSKHISDQLWEEDVSKQSGFKNLTTEDGENYGEKDDTSSDHSTKMIISETLLQIRQDPTKAVLSDSVVLSSTEAIYEKRRSKYSHKTALEKARRVEVFPPSVECHSRNSSKNGTGRNSLRQHSKNARSRDTFSLSDSSKDEMSDSLTGVSQSQQHCGRNTRRKEIFPQSNSSKDWMSVSITGSSQSQQHCRENARREVWHASVECHPQDSSEDGMSDSVTESSQSQQHLRGESGTSVSGPLAIYSGAIPSFGSISFRSNSSTTSSRSFTFPIISSEWAGSPVRMAEADMRQLQRHRRWGMRFLCCTF
ncbi:PREDICTED: uncharacterized protein LOC101293793 [Fragaria vesca subsp. vesca]|nr:PREDICTED: uncharacterized protein LOC101293793 isoform X2 [Fragaria vesca subsp. vesca]XP_011464278.1 PREDICTED: uncharacterized protein LOC101293793 isoform X2 [Fragaria vesca subsp. vesca]XP_011464279.1 PREDICTED: uncharacterized protein LOC101293793 isoform X2 [Fragaria vesca subsp. vesca]XP_011464280.1 PREDICTED: uncharacterized protein LOC101293793 isoform X2 [Fragaria vesca subsp. vesca]